jgi:hypothetical protein
MNFKATEVAVRSFITVEKETAADIWIFSTTPNTLTQFYHEWQITKTVGIKKPLGFRVRVTLFQNW